MRLEAVQEVIAAYAPTWQTYVAGGFPQGQRAEQVVRGLRTSAQFWADSKPRVSRVLSTAADEIQQRAKP